jgi:hypothetical protein
VTDLELFGAALVSHAPERLPDLHASVPVRVAVELRPAGGDLCVRGRNAAGPWESRMEVGPAACRQGSGAVVALFARERVEDLEVRRAANKSASVDVSASIDKEIEQIGLAFQIATRLTAWVAVSEELSVDPTQPTKRQRIPHALPAGLSVEGLGLRPSTGRATFNLGPTFPAVEACRGLIAWERSETSLSASAIAGSITPSTSAMDSSMKPSAMTGKLRTWLRATLDTPLRATPGTPLRARPGTPPTLTGRLTRRKKRELALEIMLDAALKWEPTAVEVGWGDEQRLCAEIVRRLTTRNGQMSPGTIVRLVVRLREDGPADPPDRVIVMTGGAWLTVTLAR